MIMKIKIIDNDYEKNLKIIDYDYVHSFIYAFEF